MPLISARGGSGIFQGQMQEKELQAQKAASRRAQATALAQLGAGVGTSVFSTISNIVAQRQAQQARMSHDQELMQSEQGFKSRMLERQHSLENPMVDEGMAAGDSGPPQQVPLNIYRAHTGRIQSEREKENTPLEKLLVAERYQNAEKAKGIPGMPPGFASGVSEAKMHGQNTPATQLSSKMDEVANSLSERGFPSTPTSILPENAPDRTRENMLRRFGMAMQFTDDPAVLKALAQQISGVGAMPRELGPVDSAKERVRDRFSDFSKNPEPSRNWPLMLGALGGPVGMGIAESFMEPSDTTQAKRQLLEYLLQAQNGQMQQTPRPLPEKVQRYLDAQK